jgi:putative nucleotidyltransferase with HDIG domain
MPKRIILADDEAHVLDVLSMKLTKAGFDVRTAADGQQALDLCLQQPPDLLITDCQMPRLDGMGLCRALQERPETRGIPRIMLTAREFEIEPGQAEQAGISALLAKPFSPRQVLEKAVEFLPVDAAEEKAVAVATQPEPNQIPADPNVTGHLADLAGRLQPRLKKLAAVVSVWDAEGHCLHQPAEAAGCQEFCGDKNCFQKHKDLAVRTVETGRSEFQAPQKSCCLLSVPIRTTGQPRGAVVVSVPIREMVPQGRTPGEEMYTRGQARGLLEMVAWLVESEQAHLESENRLRHMSSNLSLTYEELELVYSLSSAIRINQQSETFLKQVCNEVSRTVGAQVGIVVYPHSDQQGELAVLCDGLEISQDQFRTLVAGQIAPRLSLDRAGWIDNSFSASAELGLGPAPRNCLAAALISGDEMFGVLVCLNKTGEFDSVDLKLAGAVGGQTAAFLANRALFSDMEELFMGVLRSLTATIDAKDAYTGQHSDRVARLSRTLAQRMGLNDEQIREIYLAGMLHDIGKIGVPESILCKPDKLTDEEFDRLKEHPELGARILSGIRQLDGVVEGILSHHERPDGRGYPRGLSGQDVPIAGRIICLADSFDAMASNRPYRDALPMDVVIEEIQKNAGTQFDTQLVEIFMTLDLEEFTD